MMLKKWEQNNIFRYSVAGLFFLLILVGFMPQIVIDSEKIGLLDLLTNREEIHMSGLENLEDIPLLGGVADAAEGFLRSLITLAIIGVIFAAIQCALTMILKRPALPILWGASIFVNMIVRFLFTSRVNGITGALDRAGGLLDTFLGQEMEVDLIALNGTPRLLWVLIHLAIAFALVASVIARRKGDEESAMFREEPDRIVERPFPVTGSKPSQPKSRQVAKPREKMPFAGAIIARSGKLKDKAFPMMPGEKVLIGVSREGEIEIVDESGEQLLCQISYNDEKSSYALFPQSYGVVFLKSGQPLGKHRMYELKRGTEITVGVAGIFELA